MHVYFTSKEQYFFFVIWTATIVLYFRKILPIICSVNIYWIKKVCVYLYLFKNECIYRYMSLFVSPFHPM